LHALPIEIDFSVAFPYDPAQHRQQLLLHREKEEEEEKRRKGSLELERGAFFVSLLSQYCVDCVYTHCWAVGVLASGM
jgi:hypothetical protein